MVGAVWVDLDGVDDPTLSNDRLLLGVKGTISEFELSLFRQRSSEAILQKARRGELQIPIPVAFCGAPSGRLEKDPDQRVQQALPLVFRKMTELGSARQVLMWFRQENILLPSFPHDSLERPMIWKWPGYASLHAMLTNPVYAGAYVYGRRETRTTIVDGGSRKSAGHRKPQSEWKVWIKDHHPSYLSWEEYARNQSMMAANAYMIDSGAERKAGRGGRALFSGLLRCQRCGRMMQVVYPGPVVR